MDEYGFLVTPYRKVSRSKVTDEIVYLRADEEMQAIWSVAVKETRELLIGGWD